MEIKKKLIVEKKINSFYNNKQIKIISETIKLFQLIKYRLYKRNTNKNLTGIFNYLVKALNLTKSIKFKNLILKNENILTFNKFNNDKNNLQKKMILNKNLITHIIHVNLLNSNIIVNITDLNGIPIIYCSSGIVNFSGSQKTKHLALQSIINKITYKSKNLNHNKFAIHFKGIKKDRKKIYKKLKKKFEIKTLKVFNLSPHNGCRPRKIKKKK